MKPLPQTTSEQHKNQPENLLNGNTELSSLDIDQHAAFWSTYEKVADDHDTELLDGWNKSLDILLIFAALFSAINTAFIVESYKGLRPDPTETTNSLLRILIKHRADNVTLSEEDLHPWNTDSSVVPVNSVFFASLSLSLTAAFGAVTAKQWLTEYSKTGSIKALHKQCRVRQAKFDGLETWRFHFLIELLPLILQLSLLIFLVGVVQFIWVLERRIAVMELVFSAAGLGLYLTTIIISMVFPASPFQTPLSRYSLQALTGISQISHQIGRKIGSLALTISLSFPSHRLRNWWEQRIHDGLDLLSTPMIDRIRQIWKHLFLGVDSCYARLLHPRHQPIARTSENWSKRDKLAAGTVVWLLEHSEHIDTTAVALDATLRLPGDLILSLINQKEGLRERLVMFHLNQISLASDASNPESADRMIIAQMALFHMFKLDGCLAYQPHLPLNCPIPIQVQIGGEGRHSNLKDSPSDSKLLAPVIVKWSQAVLSIPHCESLLRPRTLKIGLNVSKRNVATNSFVSSVIPAHLALEALTCSMLLGHTPPISTSSLEDNKWGDITRGIQNLLNDEPSWSTISYTALAVAAMHWKSPPEGGAGRWCYTTMDQEMDLEYSLKRSIYAPDKGKMVLHNVALALSLVDPNSRDLRCELLCRLLSLMQDEFSSTLTNDDQTCRSRYPHLPESLLLLSRKVLDSVTDRCMILRILGNCQGWTTSSTLEYAEDIIQLIVTRFSAFDDSTTLSTELVSDPSPLHQLTAEIVSMKDAQLFEAVFLSENGVMACSYDIASWVAIQPVYGAILASISFQFGGPSPRIRECQIDVALRWLTRLHGSIARGSEVCQQGIETLAGFLGDLFTVDFHLEWPPYYPSDFIQAMNCQRDQQVQHGFLDLLEYHHLEHVWIGDMTLMLWKASHEAQRDSWLRNDWSDLAFFEPDVVESILFHEDHLLKESFECIDYSTLGNYFKMVLKLESALSQGEGSRPPDQYYSHGSSPLTQGLSSSDCESRSNIGNTSQGEEDMVMTNATAGMDHADLYARIQMALDRIEYRTGDI